MTTAIDIFDEMIKEYEGIDGIYHEVYDTLNEAKSRIQALGDGWIPVTERLPEEYSEVIFYADGIGTGVYEDGMLGNQEYAIDMELVTHWMPLPNNPKQ